LTQLTPAYRLRVAMVLGSLFLFLAFYLGLVAGSGYLLYFLWELPTPRGRGVIVQFGALLGCAMLFLFLLKGLFKRTRVESDHLIDVQEAKQPDLFRFIRRLCEEAGSAFPGKIYLALDVNAAVTYPRSLLRLVWPLRKRLIIGLGVVNALNLSQFKAVLAHEFGHFAQSSMRLGQYVYVANQVIADMVFKQDFWDELLLRWRRLDLRLSFPAWGLSVVVWAVRHALGFAFKGINFLNFSLSRQMEFNADLHAVRLAGSDAIVSGLLDTERGAIAFQRALGKLASLAEHQKCSADVYHHHRREIEALRGDLAKEADTRPEIRYLAAPYRAGPELHFPPAPEHDSSIWSTHPSNQERERNAKSTYIGVPEDRRPAWTLFRDAASTRRLASLALYRTIFGIPIMPASLLPPEEVESLAREEAEEQRQAPQYFGFYDGRFVEPGRIDDLVEELKREVVLGSFDAAALRQEAAVWTGEPLKQAMAEVQRLEGERNLLTALATGQIRPKSGTSFEFRGRQVELHQALTLFKDVDQELAGAHERLHRGDRAIFRHFFHRSGGSGSADDRLELLGRYEFLLAVQDLIRRLIGVDGAVMPLLEGLQGRRELSKEEHDRAIGTFQQASGEFHAVLVTCDSLCLPKLFQLEEGKSVRSFVLPADALGPPHSRKIEGQWIGAFLQQFQQVLGRLRKLHFKNLGQLLKLQERLDPELFASREWPQSAEGGSVA
jgi:Zn-dependent protease with chaperone function